MRISLGDKQIWPPLDGDGFFSYRFEKEPDGTVTYSVFSVDKNGTPDERYPLIVIVIEKPELQRLLGRLGVRETDRGEQPYDSNKRSEMMDVVGRIDKLHQQDKDSL